MGERQFPGIRRRLACMFYESLLLAAVLAVAFLLPLTLLSAFAGRTMPGGAVSWPYLFAVLGAYFLWHWRRGQTLAMRTWKLELRSADGKAPAWRQLILRYLLAWPSVLSGVGILWALFDPDRQFLHDRLAGTRIISAPPTTTSPQRPAGTGRWA